MLVNQKSLKFKEVSKNVLIFCLFSSATFGLITFLFGRDGLPFGDATDYTNGAKSILDGQGPLLSGSWPYFRPPGYPFLIALAWRITQTESITLLIAINCTLHVVNAFMAGAISKMLFKNNSQNVVMGLYLVNPFLLYQLAGVQTEPAITSLCLFFLLSALLFISTSKSTRPGLANLIIFLNAVIVIIATSIRPEYLLIFLVFFPFMLIFARLTLAKILKYSVLWMTPILLSLLIWNLYMRPRVGGIILLTDATGFQFWQGTTSLALEAYVKHFWTNPPIDLMTQWSEHVSNLMVQFQAEYGWSGLSLVQKAHIWQDLAFENITSDPLRVLGIFIVKFVFFLRPFLLPSAYGITLFLVSFIWYAIWFLLTFVALQKIFRQMKLMASGKELWLAFLIFFFVANLSNSVVHTIQMADLRYRVPLLEPYMVILICYLYLPFKEKVKRLRNV